MLYLLIFNFIEKFMTNILKDNNLLVDLTDSTDRYISFFLNLSSFLFFTHININTGLE